MMRSRFRRRRGTRMNRRARVAGVALVACLGAVTGSCNYGFEGGGFPPHIRTIYIEPFENETPQFELQGQIFTALVDELPGQLGLRTAGQESADAILRGRILRYDDVAQNYRPGTDQAVGATLAHEVQIGITAELVDIRDNVIRWEARTLTGRGTYDPTSQTEVIGQAEAIENLIEQIIDGAQSQW